jgi:hypothetical protein
MEMVDSRADGGDDESLGSMQGVDQIVNGTLEEEQMTQMPVAMLRGLVSWVPRAPGYGAKNLDTIRLPPAAEQLGSRSPHARYDPTTLG